jgi:phosphatidylglycerol lysyltransferase
LQALLAWVRAHGRRFYNFEGLESFKAKFQPEEWEPVYAIANQPRFSLAALCAIGAAFIDGSLIGATTRALWWAIRQELAHLDTRPRP